MHIHVNSPDGDAKFWLEPTVALANHAERELNELHKLVEEHADEFKRRWQDYFRS